MEKTLFHIKEMDCPAEEQMVRMKPADFKVVKQLAFDLENRDLTVFHDGGLESITAAINSLNFGSSVTATGAYTESLPQDDDTTNKKLLWTVLIINFSMFVIGLTSGFIARSMGLVADSLDELADAFVYGLSIYAIAGTLIVKKRVARISGILQLLLAIAGFVEVIRRFIGQETVPNPIIMMAISVVALIANTASLLLLGKTKGQEVNIKASKIFTSNDVIVNIGVIAAGVLVLVLGSKIPDLVIGAVVFTVVLRGSISIIKLSK
ncbi:transporter [Spirochaetia bacterium]|nr:transporter [Spirochaetia bacterium]